MNQLLLGISLPWLPSFDNFVVGRNSEVHTALRSALDNPAAERAIYLWGAPNSGKSHLLQAMAAYARERGRTAVYAKGTVPDSAQVVAVDDVESLDDTAQVSLFELYNRLREGAGLMLLSGNVAPAHLNLRDDLRTRLGWGLVYQLHELNDEEKSLALQQHARARDFTVPDEVTDYLLRHGRRDWPYLLGVLDKLDDRCLSLKKRAATVPLLKEVMSAQAVPLR